MRPKILIAAGGTGGHILPAIALGQVLSARKECDVAYLCGERLVELDLYRNHGIRPIVMPVRQLGVGVAQRCYAVWSGLRVAQSIAALLRKEHYDAVIGMGGYVAGPALLAAVFTRRASVIHEANAIPGRTNRWFAPWVDETLVNFPRAGGLMRCRRCTVTGMPIRAEIYESGTREEGIREFELDAEKRTLLIIGGSQGARYLYRSLMSALPILDKQKNNDVQILWSTGTTNFDELSQSLAALHLRFISVKLRPFIDRMDLALAVADAAISRAGASSIAELLARGVYALYIPLPSAVYDHQRWNAEEVQKLGAGEYVLERELSPELAAERIERVLEVADQKRELVLNAGQIHREAAGKCADVILDAIRRRRRK